MHSWERFSLDVSDFVLDGVRKSNKDKAVLRGKFYDVIRSKQVLPEIYYTFYHNNKFNAGTHRAAINISKFYIPTGWIDLPALENAVRNLVIFMDYLSDKDKGNKDSRKITISIIGFADLLLKLGFSYGSDNAIKTAEFLSWFIRLFSYMQSSELSEKYGTFKGYTPNKFKNFIPILKSKKFGDIGLDIEDLENTGVRNTLELDVNLAQHGLASIAGVSPGIYPILSLVISIMDWSWFEEVKENYISIDQIITETSSSVPLITNMAMKKILYDILCGLYLVNNDIISRVVEDNSIENIKEIPDNIKEVFKTNIENRLINNMKSAWC